MNITFRPAQPDDVTDAVPLIYSSGPHEFDYVFARGSITALDYLAFAFPTGQGFSSYHICTVALVNNAVVGISACHSGQDNKTINRGNFAIMWRFYGFWHILPVIQRAIRIASVLPPPDRDTDYISQVGVTAAFRGHGIGTALIQRQLQISRLRAQRKCALDVAITNNDAQKLYERLGFKVVQERAWKYHTPHHPVPDQRRMGILL